MRRVRKPYAEREHLFCFHGSLQHSLYEGTHAGRPFDTVRASDIRNAILNFRNFPGASIGGHLVPVLKYYQQLGNCKFCLVPKGVGYTNGRLFESFHNGCIPVILSDALRLPFSEFLDWSLFSVRFPTAQVWELPKALQVLDELASSLPSGTPSVVVAPPEPEGGRGDFSPGTTRVSRLQHYDFQGFSAQVVQHVFHEVKVSVNQMSANLLQVA